MFAPNFKVYRTDVACAGSPGNHFLNLSLADLEIMSKGYDTNDSQK